MDDEKLARFERAANKLSEAFTSNNSHSSITINAGGWGVFACAIMCAFMSGLAVALLVGQVKHENRLDKIDQYVSVIYQQLPSLRKGEK
jgi:hypothetical protein